MDGDFPPLDLVLYLKHKKEDGSVSFPKEFRISGIDEIIIESFG
ncbi:MAG: hypothetical protein CM15mP44_7870 [Candidatus Neomarinimicrobiota bacterium]|nr:MAG: hypothetical protein CM15mP44_7870 [Candidatus Neomarinimicrobiota bacterium]